MSKTSLRILGALALVTAGACSSDDGDDALSWGGDTAHLEIRGFLNGETIDFVMDSAVAADEANLRCVREYEVPLVEGVPDYSQAKFVEAKLNGIVEVGGEQRIMELEFKQHALNADPVGAEVFIVPRVDGVAPEADQMWFEWEWHDLADEDLYEAAARQGSFELEMFTGTPDADGIIPEGDGSIGGVVNAVWSATEEAEVSFTAPCNKTKITEIE